MRHTLKQYIFYDQENNKARKCVGVWQLFGAPHFVALHIMVNKENTTLSDSCFRHLFQPVYTSKMYYDFHNNHKI